jgi:ketosteroid isomerase-like protein
MRAARPGAGGLAACAAAACLLAAAAPARAQDADQASARQFVEDFLLRLGDHRYDTLDADFSPGALVVVSRQHGGSWTNGVEKAEEWLAGLKQNPNPVTFREPLHDVAVTIDNGRIAHLRAGFEVVREGRALSTGIDEFTLLRDGDRWRIAMVAYTSMPR